jgi:quercetin dioxygenase-like cupin family protein
MQNMKTYFSAAVALSAIAIAAISAPSIAAQEEGTGGRCVPIAERGERQYGCYVIGREAVGALSSGDVYWHIERFADLASARNAAGPRSAAVEAFGDAWLVTIEQRGWRSEGGEPVAEIGPLPVQPAEAFTAQYMEVTFRPGMKSGIAARHGPEAWHTLSGESCIETPEGTSLGRAGGVPVILDPGVPLQVTATGSEERRSLVLVLHDASRPPAMPVADWQPRGLCDRFLTQAAAEEPISGSLATDRAALVIGRYRPADQCCYQ